MNTIRLLQILKSEIEKIHQKLVIKNFYDYQNFLYHCLVENEKILKSETVFYLNVMKKLLIFKQI